MGLLNQSPPHLITPAPLPLSVDGEGKRGGRLAPSLQVRPGSRGEVAMIKNKTFSDNFLSEKRLVWLNSQ